MTRMKEKFEQQQREAKEKKDAQATLPSGTTPTDPGGDVGRGPDAADPGLAGVEAPSSESEAPQEGAAGDEQPPIRDVGEDPQQPEASDDATSDDAPEAPDVAILRIAVPVEWVEEIKTRAAKDDMNNQAFLRYVIGYKLNHRSRGENPPRNWWWEGEWTADIIDRTRREKLARVAPWIVPPEPTEEEKRLQERLDNPPIILDDHGKVVSVVDEAYGAKSMPGKRTVVVEGPQETIHNAPNAAQVMCGHPKWRRPLQADGSRVCLDCNLEIVPPHSAQAGNPNVTGFGPLH